MMHFPPFTSNFSIDRNRADRKNKQNTPPPAFPSSSQGQCLKSLKMADMRHYAKKGTDGGSWNIWWYDTQELNRQAATEKIFFFRGSPASFLSNLFRICQHLFGFYRVKQIYFASQIKKGENTSTLEQLHICHVLGFNSKLGRASLSST